ncbi:MAG: hypoxanthine phosphoribosyltransferase [Pseudomonadota bacterium]
MTAFSAPADAAESGNKIEVLIPEQEIANRLKELASEISAAEARNLLVIPVLKGSFVFAADLIRALHSVGMEPEVDFMTLSSYRKSTVSSGTVDILRDCEVEVSGRSVLLVDDVLDSGRTLAFAKDLITARGASKISTCVLLEKQKHRAVELEADYTAFPCPETFVIGYGMDLAHRYRELPFVGQLITPE